MLSFKEIVKKIENLEEANILISALELKIFSFLEKKTMSARKISLLTKTKPVEMEVLLNVLAAMGALIKIKNCYKNTSVTYKFFCETSFNYKTGTVLLLKDGRDEYEKILKKMRKGRNLKDFEVADDPRFRKQFTYAMHERSQIYSKKIANVVSKGKVGKLIDLGCGPGSYSVEILKKAKNATATLFDRPAALKVAREIHNNKIIYRRLNFVSGDLFDDEFGVGYDTVFLSNIMHIYNVNENKVLLKKIKNTLKQNGRLFLYDFFLKDSKVEPYNAALFAITMLLYTNTGKSYTFSEVYSLLRSIGFGHIKKTNIESGSSIIEAIKV